ncbi:MAG: M48 family metallopeptidase [bacterium]|nr:M48 family metallopeptidase [bacterium]
MLYDQISSNKFRSSLMVIGFIIFVMLVVYIFSQAMGYGTYVSLPLAVIIASISGFSSYYYSDKIVLAMSRARPASREEYLQLHNIVEGLCIAAGLPLPKIYVIDDTAPNAFATGRNPQHSVIAVTTGLLQKLNRTELEGVIAHELAHIKNYDILLQTLTVVMVGIVALLSDWFLRIMRFGSFSGRRSRIGRTTSRSGGNPAMVIFVILGIILALLSPLIAQLIRLAISRRREFLADATGALLTRYPPGLASALKKIAADTEPLEVANKATAHLYIVNPLKDFSGKINNLFSTHPPIEERIAALEKM